MRLEPFAIERLQSIWEHRVAWNLAESGVHPLRVEELAESPEDRLALLQQPLVYTQTNGTLELRSAIAAMYSGASPAHIQVTTGGSEANWLTLWTLVERGDEIVLMLPNYMQVRGLARAFGVDVKPWPLLEDSGTPGGPAPMAAGYRRPEARSSRTGHARSSSAIPNNPTGARLTSGELDEICAIASRSGAWVVSDEIYRGAELDGVETPTVWGRYERVIVTVGLSKAYSLPGLRTGWVVATACT